jgi:hypothetical protein
MTVIRDGTAIETVEIIDLAVTMATTATWASLGVIAYMLRITGNVIRSVFKSALFSSYCVYAANNGNVIRSVFESALKPLLELLQC